MKAGFENEFYLRRKLVRYLSPRSPTLSTIYPVKGLCDPNLQKTCDSEGHERWVPYDNSSYCSTSSFDGASSILQEVYSSLKEADIVVEQLHAEAGKGQFEVALKYVLCTLAADNLIYAREIIKSVARKHELIATFLPK
jgi:glutamine synthetase